MIACSTTSAIVFGSGAPAALEPSWPKTFVAAPAVDVAETDKSYEITAELPGMDEKNIEVNLANGGITIKGEKKEETNRRPGN